MYSYTDYATCAQSRLYLNDVFLDEFNYVMWKLATNLIPKFGYCSSKYDDMARGKSLVQGQLAVNYVSPGYLIGALMGNTAANVGAAVSSSSPSQQFQQLLQEQAKLSGTTTVPTIDAQLPGAIDSRPISVR